MGNIPPPMPEVPDCGPRRWCPHGQSEASLCAPCPPACLPLWLCLAEVRVLQLGQEEVGTALQVGAGYVERQVGHQLPEAGEVGGLTEVLRALVQPGAQDGGDSTGGRWVGSRVRAWPFLPLSPTLAPPGGQASGLVPPIWMPRPGQQQGRAVSAGGSPQSTVTTSPFLGSLTHSCLPASPTLGPPPPL